MCILKISHSFQMINPTVNGYDYGTTTLAPSSLGLNINRHSSCKASFVNIKYLIVIIKCHDRTSGTTVAAFDITALQMYCSPTLNVLKLHKPILRQIIYFITLKYL